MNSSRLTLDTTKLAFLQQGLQSTRRKIETLVLRRQHSERQTSIFPTLHGEIIHDGKLAVAENLLLTSKFSINEIIFKSGFSSRASFYRAFTKKHGFTPKDFMEKKLDLRS